MNSETNRKKYILSFLNIKESKRNEYFKSGVNNTDLIPFKCYERKISVKMRFALNFNAKFRKDETDYKRCAFPLT